jgi:hypothetical protein
MCLDGLQQSSSGGFVEVWAIIKQHMQDLVRLNRLNIGLLHFAAESECISKVIFLFGEQNPRGFE